MAGLLALMLLTDARRPARTGPAGQLIPLAEQDRTRWNETLIAEGIALLSAVLPRRAVGEYQLQAAIAAIHDEAATAEDTDWPQILALYGLLERMTGNPMVTLSRAIASAMVHGPAAGLTALADLDAASAGPPSHSTRSGRTCWTWPATPMARSRTTCGPPAVPPASPSATTSPPGPRACASGGPDLYRSRLNAAHVGSRPRRKPFRVDATFRWDLVGIGERATEQPRHEVHPC